MLLNVLKGKIHRARVVQAELDYVGSITVDTELARAAGILEYEKVQVVDIDNGNRFETYVIAGRARKRYDLLKRRRGQTGAGERQDNHHVLRADDP